MKQSFGKSLAVLLTSLVGLHFITSDCHAVPWKLTYKDGEKIPLQQVSIQSEKGHQFFGTFWSAQRVNYPPLPCYPLFLREAGYDVPVYALDSERGVFLVDDRAVDYEAIYKEREKKKQEETLLRSLALNTGLMSMEEFSLLEGESLYSSYAEAYTTNDLWLEINEASNGCTGWTANLTIHRAWGDTNLFFDVLYAPKLNSPTPWRYLMRTAFTNLTARWLCEEQGYFALSHTNGVLAVSTNITAKQMAERLVPPWVNIYNATNRGALVALGWFTNGNGCGLPIEAGIILSTGNITNASGKNTDTGQMTSEYSGGNGTSFLHSSSDVNLNSLLGTNLTFDAAVLEFDVYSTNSFTLQIQYLFASEEYPEWISTNGGFNDVMAIFVTTNWSGTNWIITTNDNIALVPCTDNTAVSINKINGGCLSDANYTFVSPTNAHLYVDNADPTYGAATNAAPAQQVNIQYDGLTVLLNAEKFIASGVTNHIKIAIEDYGDSSYDSAIFIKQWTPSDCH